MATLNVNNYVLTIYSDECNFVLNIGNTNFANLKCTPPAKKQQSSLDPYLGLTRYCAALSHDGKYYAVADERNLAVWSTSNWVEKCSKVLERSASKIIFTPSNQAILVADKTGDVYLFSLSDDAAVKGTLVLGHLSMLLDMLITPDEKYIITCDRDEKIRVTCYPNTYNIERFCLGHLAFVTKMLLVDDNVLLSSSGDGSLKFWNFLKGDCLSTHSVYEDVKDHFSDKENQCIIMNLAFMPDDGIICLSIHKFNGIVVYKYNSNLSLTLIQKIDCNEPLDFALHERTLWVLKPSNDCPLNAFLWNQSTGNFGSHTSENVNNVLNVVRSECSHLLNCSYVDLSMLYKKFDLKEKSKVEKCVENPGKKVKIS